MAVDWLADAGDLAVVLPERRAPGVAEGIVGTDFVGGVVCPGFGIADADVEGIELGLGFGAGGGREPGERVEALVICGDKIGDQGLRLGLGFGREVFLRVDLADGVAEKRIDEANAKLPEAAKSGAGGSPNARRISMMAATFLLLWSARTVKTPMPPRSAGISVRASQAPLTKR
jgi:hypothetical protein